MDESLIANSVGKALEWNSTDKKINVRVDGSTVLVDATNNYLKVGAIDFTQVNNRKLSLITVDADLNMGTYNVLANNLTLTIQDQHPVIYFNAKYDGGDKYVASDSAFQIWHDKDNDVLRVRGAVSGTAGNTITWNEALQVKADGTIIVSQNVLKDSTGTTRITLGNPMKVYQSVVPDSDNSRELGAWSSARWSSVNTLRVKTVYINPDIDVDVNFFTNSPNQASRRIYLGYKASTSTTTTQNSSILTFRGSYWDSGTSSSKNYLIDLQGIVLNTTPVAKLSVKFQGVEKAYVDSAGNLWVAGNLQVGGNNILDSAGKTRVTLSATNTATKISTDYGYVTIGPQNSTYCHFNTDRTQFYFNKQVVVNGNVIPYVNDSKSLGDASHRWTHAHLRYGVRVYTQGNAPRSSEDEGYKVLHAGGPTSDFIITLQDGTGRVQFYWNATPHGGDSASHFIVGSENAGKILFSPSNDPFFVLAFASGSGANAGDTITWSEKLRLYTNGNLWVAGDFQAGGNTLYNSDKSRYLEMPTSGNSTFNAKDSYLAIETTYYAPLVLRRNTSSASYSTSIIFQAKDNAGNWQTYNIIDSYIGSSTNGAEYGWLDIRLVKNGSIVRTLVISGRTTDVTNNAPATSTYVGVDSLYYRNQYTYSSERFKENIKPINREKLAKYFDALQLYEFNYKGDEKRKVWLVAERVREKAEWLVSGDGIDVTGVISVLIGKIANIENRLKKLEAMVK